MNHPFHVSTFPVPQRLSLATRELARRYLFNEKKKIVPAEFTVPTTDSLYKDYAENIRLIAASAPLGIDPAEKLVGAATLDEGPQHKTPGGRFYATSHTTVDFAGAVREGLHNMEKRVRASMAVEGRSREECEFLEAALSHIGVMRLWRDRYIAALADKPEMQTVRERLSRVPEYAPETFEQAVQSLWFFFCFLRLAGNWSGIGRIDEMLGSYLKADLAAGRTTLDEAREILAHFWIKGTEWRGLFGEGGSITTFFGSLFG